MADNPLTFGSLFAGIGGFDLGFERAGMRCVWQVEIDDYCNRVLAKHWPAVQRYRDVRECGAHNLAPVDVICGGFPCQDISIAGKGAGIDGERSGLWREYARIIRELRPRYVVVENVAALLGRGFGRVLGDLAACGYDAEWTVLSAEMFGAPHKRERVFVVAYRTEERYEAHHAVFERASQALATPASGRQWGKQYQHGSSGRIWPMPDAGVFRVVDGVPARLDVDRVGACGNAVMPQIAEYIGRAIVADALALRQPYQPREAAEGE